MEQVRGNTDRDTGSTERDGGILEVTREEYDASERVRSTALKEFMSECPYYYYRKYVVKDIPSKWSEEMSLGTLLHSLVLEDNIEWVVFDGVKKGKKYEEALDSNPGMTLIKPDAEKKILGMAEGLLRNEAAWSLLRDGGFSEQAIGFEKHGVQCKALLDRLLFSGDIVDLKTTRQHGKDASNLFLRDVHNYGYHHSAAYYEMARDALMGYQPGRDFLWVCVSATPPHSCWIQRLPDQLRETAARDVENALVLLNQCMTNDEWPELHDGEIVDAMPPMWMLEKNDYGYE